MGRITLQSILQALDPRQPPEALFAGIVCYTILLLALIALFMQRESSTRDVVILTLIIFFCLIDKITTASVLRDQVNISGFTRGNPFGTFMIRVGMFALPMIVAGSTKTEKSRPILIGTGLLGGAYLFARWFFEIRPQ